MAGRPPAAASETPIAASHPGGEAVDTAELVTLPAGLFAMGCEDPGAYAEDGEGPVRPVHLGSFQLDRHAVSNERFARFVAATGYTTDAETFGSAFVFAGSYLVARDRMRRPLENLRVWLQANNATVMSVPILVIGVTQIGKGLGGLL